MNKREGSDGELNRVMTMNREVELTWRKDRSRPVMMILIMMRFLNNDRSTRRENYLTKGKRLYR